MGDMREELYGQMKELLRETFEGALPGQGTQYLDHASGVRASLKGLTAEQASARHGDHPSIAAHVRHMAFHLRVAYEWIQGDTSRRDWKGSFEPQAVTPAQWLRLQQELEEARDEFLRVMESLPLEKLIAEGVGMGALSHLAYHLGAIRQRLL
jgi:hypothetical protein